MNDLDNLTESDIRTGKLQLDFILRNSAYYPACEFDGRLIRFCNLHRPDLNVTSFVYCDYAVGKQRFLEEQSHFFGYKIVGSREVSPQELIPNGWTQRIPPGVSDLARDDYWAGNMRGPRDQAYRQYQDYWQPFIIWTVYERQEERDRTHGSHRFSLLYIGGEGVATYQAIYWSNRACPVIVEIYHAGTGFGLNWTDFRHKEGPMAWVIRNNPAGQPKYIFFDSTIEGYPDSQWEGYAFHEETKLYTDLEKLLIYKRI